jgi:hypothetical protein
MGLRDSIAGAKFAYRVGKLKSRIEHGIKKNTKLVSKITGIKKGNLGNMAKVGMGAVGGFMASKIGSAVNKAKGITGIKKVPKNVIR